MGVTYTGMYEPVRQIADGARRDPGADRARHRRSTSTAPPAAMIAPFLQPDLEWDFRIDAGALDQHLGPQVRPRVPGPRLGRVARQEYLPDDLVFDVSYLGGDMPTFALNFSRPGAQVLLQYYLFLRLGRRGLLRGAEGVAGRRAVPRRRASRSSGPSSCGTTAATSRSSRGASRTGHTDKWTLYDLSGPAAHSRAGSCRRTRCRTTSTDVDGAAHRGAQRAQHGPGRAAAQRHHARRSQYLDGLDGPMPHEAQQSAFHH